MFEPLIILLSISGLAVLVFVSPRKIKKKMQNAKCKMQNAKCKMQNAKLNFELRDSD